MKITTPEFKSNAVEALADENLQKAMGHVQVGFIESANLPLMLCRSLRHFVTMQETLRTTRWRIWISIWRPMPTR